MPKPHSGAGSVRELRAVKTMCPTCLKWLPGRLLQKEDSVVLSRICEEHGVSEMVLSRNPSYYAEWDRFYFDVLKRGVTRGRVMNYWVVCTHSCQMNCNYCQSDVQNPIFDEMDIDDLDRVMHRYRKTKLTLSGGEPSLHRDVFHFFRSASRMGLATQLATNGLKLADVKFCEALKAAGAKEIRLSYELLAPEHSEGSEFCDWLDARLEALRNLENGQFHINLSPTVFKGLNETVLLDTLNYAKNSPSVTSISVNGFSWVGHGVVRDPHEMIMPDEMMDVICRGIGVKDRESIFTFQKAFFTLLQLARIRMCMYTQLMVFIRRKGRLDPIVDYFNMGRMKKALRLWERFNTAPYPLQLVTFCAAMAYSMRPRTLALVQGMVGVVLKNVFRVDFTRYPNWFLPLVLNTNCSRLTVDEEVSKQCMSGIIMKRDGKIACSHSTHLLIEKELLKQKRTIPTPEGRTHLQTQSAVC
jgi:MoaA/NifB/PqqE/SkfB family radical SAM enzyme